MVAMNSEVSAAPPALRRAIDADVTALHALVNSAYRGESSRAGWTTEADLLGGQRTDAAALAEFIERGAAQDDRAMLVMPRGDVESATLIACVQLERRGDDAYLGMLTVAPSLQGAGLGKYLLAGAEAFVARAWKTRTVTMTVIEQRSELIAWYERRGYAHTGATAPFPYGDVRFGEPKRPDLRFVVLRKRLS